MADERLRATLLSIWAEVLERDAVGPDDNFFDLGGDSMLALAIAGRAASEGLAVEAASVFECQTVAALAAHIAQEQGSWNSKSC